MRVILTGLGFLAFLFLLFSVSTSAVIIISNSCFIEGSVITVNGENVTFETTFAKNDTSLPCLFHANEEVTAYVASPVYNCSQGSQTNQANCSLSCVLRPGDEFSATLRAEGDEWSQTNRLDNVFLKNPSCAPIENCGLDCGEAGFSKNSRGCYECVCATQAAPNEAFFRFSFASGWNAFSFPLAVQRSVFCVPGKECLQRTGFLPRIVATDCDSQSVLWGWIDGGRSYSEFQLPDLGKKEMISFAGELLTGYWIKTKTPCSITIAGKEVSAVQLIDMLQPTEKQLFTGWNLVGAPLAPTFFDNIKGDCVVEKGPYAWDAAAQKFVKMPQLEPGNAYFVKVVRDCWLSVRG